MSANHPWKPIAALVFAGALLTAGPAAAELNSLGTGGFIVQHETVVPGTALEAYDAFTRDIGSWWDHTHSDRPLRVYLEARPGGGFYEIFDEEGNGALHATVIYAQPGKRLRFTGPLGFSGFPLEMVHTVDFDTADEAGKTRVVVTVRGAGQLQEEWGPGVDRVWHHFLIERYKPYVESLHPDGAPPPQP